MIFGSFSQLLVDHQHHGFQYRVMLVHGLDDARRCYQFWETSGLTMVKHLSDDGVYMYI